MSIKTHYALKMNNESDNANLSARTSHGSNTKLYLACNEGTGTTVTDFSNEGYILDNADANTTIANGSVDNTMAIVHNNSGPFIPNAGNVANASPAGQSFVIFCAVDILITPALVTFIMGGSTGGAGLGWSGTNSITDGTVTVSIPGVFTGGAGSRDFMALVVDREEKVMTKYKGTIAQIKTEVAIPDTLGDITFPNTLQISSSSQNIYGVGMRIFPNGVPDTIDADIAELNASLITSDKALPVNWLLNQ